MKKILSSTISGLLISATVASSGFAATSSFSDIENSYAKNAIIDLQAKGILSGIDANSFDPKGELTRAQFVTMMVKALGLPVDVNAKSSFSDVEGWAVPYIEAANKAGIIHGIGNGKFDPSSVLTREQSAVILVLSLKTQGALDDKDATLDFKDADKISSWAKSAVALALKYGLITGNPDGTFNPNGNASREMAAVMGENFIKSADVVKTQDTTPTPTPTDTATPTPTPTDGSEVTVVSPVVITTPTPAPVAISNIHIVSDDSANNALAKVGDTVTLTFTTSEEVSKLDSFKINGGNPTSFTSVTSGSAWLNTATYVIDGSDPEGAMNFQINVMNLAGIYSVTTEATTDGSSVTVLKAPVISAVHLQSSNVDPSKAKIGDTVTLTFSTNQQVSKLGNFKINGSNPASFSSVASGSAWTNTATYVLDGTDPVGAMNFQINVENAVGLYSNTTEATTDSSSVYATDPSDTAAPGEIANVSQTSTSPTEATLTWTNPIDVDFEHVNIYRDGVLVGKSTNGTFTDTNLTAGTSYAYKFTTVDINGNESVGTTVSPIIVGIPGL